jgi:hypothetical protein
MSIVHDLIISAFFFICESKQKKSSYTEKGTVFCSPVCFSSHKSFESDTICLNVRSHFVVDKSCFVNDMKKKKRKKNLADAIKYAYLMHV